MTRRCNYRIVEGSRDAPRRLVVRVSSHNKKYGRVSLPNCLVGLIVEVVIPETPLDASVLGDGEPPVYIQRKPRKTKEEPPQQEQVQEAEAVA